MKALCNLLPVLVLFALVSCTTPPANDNCTSAQSIPLPATPACPNGNGAAVTISGTTVDATFSNLFLTGCSVGGSQQSNAQDVWYSFVATGTILNLSINSSFATPNIGLWTGTCSSLQGIDCALGNTAGILNYTNTSIIPGQTYFINVSANTTTVPGTFTLIIDNDLDCCPQPPIATLTQPTCTTPTGTITITSPAPAAGITYSIDGINYTNTTGIFTGLAPNTYSVTVKNASGCVSAATSYTINAAPLTPAVPTATLTQPTCTTPTGTITITSPAPAAGITYSIDGINYTNTTGIFTGIAPNTYSVTVKNASGCVSAATSYTINAAPLTPAVPTATLTQPTCTTPTGTITITSPAPAAGITYSIDGINYTNTTGIFTGLAPNTYSVTVKNASGCVSTATSYTINAVPLNPAAPTATLTQPTCTTPTGTITITSPAPAAGITYSIDGINYTNTTGIFTGLAPNTYSVTVKNASGCVSTATSYTINAVPLNPAAPTATLTQPTCTTPTGIIAIISPAPAAGITYSIDGINYTNTTGIFTGLAPNTYSVTVKNASGCVSTPTSYTINAVPLIPAAPTATLTQPTCTTPTGTITITSPAPAAGITYSIDGINYTNTTGIFTGLASNTYSVTVKNASGCISAATSYTINAVPLTPAAPTATLTQPTCTTPTGTITITSPVPSAGISYSIDGINYTNTTGIFTGLAPNTYSVTVKNASGCISAATSYTINAIPSLVAPSVTITSSTTSICSGGSVTFTATPTNGGSTPTYQWMINGVNVTGQTASTFSTSTLTNGNTVSVIMTSNDPCANPTTATSNPITITTTSVTPSVSINASSTSICSGGSVTFTATPTNGGSTPTYQWMINGVNVTGQTASSFTVSTLTNGNVVSVIMTSNDPCANPTTATSNPITITITSVTPSVGITSGSTSICSGGSVTFTATPTNGGSTPTYQWMINGVNVAGQTASTFTTSSLTNGNIVSVMMTSNDPCANPTTAISNPVTITTTSVIPSVGITSGSTSICSGGSVTFTATPTNGGSTPTYQWMINGVNVAGQTASTFITSTLGNGNIVSVMMTSNDPCANPATSTSNPITITTTSVTPSVTITSSITSICSGGSVTFTATPTNGGSTPTYQWMINGVNVAGQTASSFTTSTLTNGNIVSVMMTSNDPCANPTTATSNPITITTTSVTPSVTITSSTTSICSGGSVTFTATPTNGGSTPTYQWMINGVNVAGQTAPTFITSTLTNGNTVSVIMTSNDPCANPTTATSNPITITTTSVTPSVSINASSTSICSGGSVTFTATPTNGGSTPTYQWMINGVNVAGQTAPTFTTSTLTNGNIVSVMMTSNDPCANPTTAISNPVTITTTSVTPSVGITSGSTSICSGGSVTFTATPTNGGSTPTYQWMINGVNVAGQTASTFTTSSLTNGNIVSVMMTSNDPCANPTTAISNPVTITITSVTPSVGITSGSTSICSGGSVTFTATPTNGGSTPTYQWMINGVNVAGQTASTFITSTLGNGNIVSVMMTSNDPCANPATSTSNPITITTTSVTPAVTITSSTTSICSGGSVTFTATPTNGGSTPTYQWMINGVNVAGQTASTFITSTLANGNVVSVMMTSNDPCANPATSTSNPITITTTSVTPAVTITSSTTSICSGGSVTFTATPTNGGSNPTYQWMINGVNVGGQTASIFITSTLANGNVVSVIMTSNDPCANPTTATSNPIMITTTSVTPSVTITSSTTSICSGGSVTFTATPTNGGSDPTYQWMINGVNVAGQTAPTFTTSTLANGNIVSVMMTSNDPCANPTTATSNPITITTTSVTPSVTITSSSTSICSGGSVTFTATPTNGGSTPTYQWMINGVNVAGQITSTFITSTLANGNIVSVMMTSGDPCANPTTATSNPITITTTSVTPSVTITSSTTSICSGASVTFTATPTNGGSNPTYQWMINGVNVAGQTTSTFTTSTLANSNTVSVIMTSNDPCANPTTATSNPITISATSVTPSVSINASSTSICSGGSVTFTATPTNGGSTPTYQWLINGVNVAGQTASTFITSALTNGNVVSVMMTSDDPCAIPVTPVQSQSITINSGTPVLVITNPLRVCEPVSINLTASMVTSGSDAGLTYTYWQDAAATIGLSNPNAIALAGTYYIKAVSSGGCFTIKPVIVSIEQKINGIRYPTVNATSNSPLQLTARNQGTGYSYAWSPMTGLDFPNTKNPVFVNSTGLEYLITITSPAGCVTVDTLLVKINGPVINGPAVFVPKAWSPNNDGHNDYLFPFLVNITRIKYFRIYDRWGIKVFETNIIGQGWNGIYNGKPQMMDVYRWTIETEGVNGTIYKSAGTSVLLR